MFQLVRKFVFTDSHCLEEDNAKSFAELFEKLDVNKDGKVDVSELKTGLAAMGFSMGKGEAQVIPVLWLTVFLKLTVTHFCCKSSVYWVQHKPH